jgi:hypothetical protein
VPDLGFARGLDGEQFAGEIADSFFGVGFGFGPAGTAQGIEGWMGFACADVFADEMGFGDRDVEFRWFLIGFTRGEFDDEAFLTGIGIVGVW